MSKMVMTRMGARCLGRHCLRASKDRLTEQLWDGLVATER